jgi:tetratricopeptide (TPR) repeat protein
MSEPDKGQVKKALDEFFSDPAVQRGLREMAQAERVRCLEQGDLYLRQGKLREAIAEYGKDTQLEISTYGLAATVQKAYCHMGDAFRLLGEWDNAVAAYTRAMEVWQAYGYGEMPLASLAVAYVEQGQVAEAIRLCEEHPEEADDPCVRQLVAELGRLKSGEKPSAAALRGCRRSHLPIRCVSAPRAGATQMPEVRLEI